jgi:hypothetical protein
MRFLGLVPGVMLAVLAVAETSPAGDPYVIRLPKGGTLYAFDNQVRLVGVPGGGKGRDRPRKGKVFRFQRSSEEWGIVGLRSGYALISTRMRGPYNGWYLTCDHRGKEKGLFLSQKPVPGSYWWVGGGGDVINSTISTKAAGPVYEWDIAVDDRPEQFAEKDGQAFTVYRLKLARRGPTFRLTLTSP